MSEEVRELRELVAREGAKALVGRAIHVEGWGVSEVLGYCEELGVYLPSVRYPRVRLPIESIEVTGRTLRWLPYSVGPRVQVKVTFASYPGIEGGSTGGWLA